MSACGHTDASVGASGGLGSPGTRVTDVCETQFGHWELNFGSSGTASVPNC